MTDSLNSEVSLTCVHVMFPELNCSRGAAGQSKSSWTLYDQAHRVTVTPRWVPEVKGTGRSPTDACFSLLHAAAVLAQQGCAWLKLLHVRSAKIHRQGPIHAHGQGWGFPWCSRCSLTPRRSLSTTRGRSSATLC